MSDREYVLLTAMGPDRPGLVAELTAYVVRCGGNVEDSRLAVLGGQFAYIVLVSAGSESLDRLAETAAEAEAGTGLRVEVRPAQQPQVPAGARRLRVTCEAADREGVVHAVADCLSRHGGNIVDLDSSVYPAPVSGSPLFRMALTVDVPLAAVVATEEALALLARSEELDLGFSARLA